MCGIFFKQTSLDLAKLILESKNFVEKHRRTKYCELNDLQKNRSNMEIEKICLVTYQKHSFILCKKQTI